MQVFQRLQKLNLCMSHQVTSTLITSIGSEYDKEVHQWKDAALSELESTSESEVIKLSLANAQIKATLKLQHDQLLAALYRMCTRTLVSGSSESSVCSSPDSLCSMDASVLISDDENLSPALSAHSETEMNTDMEGAIIYVLKNI